LQQQIWEKDSQSLQQMLKQKALLAGLKRLDDGKKRVLT